MHSELLIVESDRKTRDLVSAFLYIPGLQYHRAQ